MKHGIKPQATSNKPHAPIFRGPKPQAQPEVASDKLQAASVKLVIHFDRPIKHQAKIDTSHKHQATSNKPLET